MTRPRSVAVESFAKVNLGLAVGERRADGYHEIVTLYQTVDLTDRLTLTLRRKSGVQVTCDDPEVPTGPANLVARAYEGLRRQAGPLPGIDVRIEKRIPPGGGLGGGSGNAGAFLLAAPALMGRPQPLGTLLGVAEELGSDVPFFLVGGLALGVSRGESVAPLRDLRRRWVVLAMSRAGASTAAVYAAHRPAALTRSRARNTIFRLLAEREAGTESLAGLRNDLLDAARTQGCGYDRILDELRDCGAEMALLSGTGSTVFGLFQSRRDGALAARRSSSPRRELVRTVGRREYLRRVLPEGHGLSGQPGEASRR